MAFENLLVRTTRFIQGRQITVQLDVVVNETWTNTIRPTTNPVEDGFDITDHAVVDPRTYSFEAVISDTPLGGAALGQVVENATNLFGSSTEEAKTRSQAAYESLVALVRDREPLIVTTGLNVLENMLITSLTVPKRNKDTSNALFFTINFQELIVVNTELVPRDQSTLRGDARLNGASVDDQGRVLKQPITADRVPQSTLNKLFGEIF